MGIHPWRLKGKTNQSLFQCLFLSGNEVVVEAPTSSVNLVVIDTCPSSSVIPAQLWTVTVAMFDICSAAL